MLSRGALALIALAAACHKVSPEPPRGIAVKVARVERASTSGAARYSAQIVPSTRLELAFKVGGYVESIAQVRGVDGQPRNLQEGDTVEIGTELASIRKTEYAQKVAEAKAAVAQAYSSYRQAKLDSSQDSKLAKSGSLPAAVADASRSKRDGAAAAMEGAKVRLDQAKTALADTSLTSPMAGVVVKRSIEVGTLVAPGTVGFVIADTTSIKAVFGVPDLFLSQIKLGAAQKITTDAFPGVEFEGKVSRVAASADVKSRVFDVDVTIPNPDGKLKAGMVAALSIDPTAIAPEADGLRVPLTAIVRPPSGAGFAVYVIEKTAAGATAKARVVELGEYLGRVVPIKSGLSGDESIVVQGAGLLNDGERVEVIP